uniref:Uncharacterized protein n=2 Tax=Acrobeloides nanus TaxID=290746 RepID=A0A914ECF8_9BILA
MLAARGVSLGLGKIHLSEINNLRADRATIGRLVKPQKKDVSKPKIIVKKHVDRKTLWTACRTVVIGIVVIIIGMGMTIIGYFDKELSMKISYNSTLNENVTTINDTLRYPLKSMQYLGPVLMGFGSFLLIIACVITLESRDKHAQIIQYESNELRKTKKEANTKRCLLANEEIQPHGASIDPIMTLSNGSVEKNLNHSVYFKGITEENIKFNDNNEIEVNFEEHEKRKNTMAEMNQTSIKLPASIIVSNLLENSNTSMNIISSMDNENLQTELLYINKPRPRGPAPIAKFDSLSLMGSAGSSPHLAKREKTCIEFR